MTPLIRHIDACTTVTLPGPRLPFAIGREIVGYMRPAMADALAAQPGILRQRGRIVLRADLAHTLPALGQAMAAQGFGRHRGEAFDVRATPDGALLATIDRGALPLFGISAMGVHLDGVVERPDGMHIWLGRRAASKMMDPNKLDHIVAGGIAAGHGVRDTLIKEAAEEAAIPATLLADARPTGRIAYVCDRAEGLRRDVLHCFEVTLPADFVPHPADGEMAGFELWPLPRVAAALRSGDDFKFNVTLVLLALLLRHNVLPPAEAYAVASAMRRVWSGDDAQADGIARLN